MRVKTRNCRDADLVVGSLALSEWENETLELCAWFSHTKKIVLLSSS